MGSIFGYSSTEQPHYDVQQKFADFELRHYGPTIRAQVEMPGPMGSQMGNAFRALAGYIFGGNTRRSGGGSENVAMTAPVAMQSEKVAMTAPVAMQSSQQGGAEGSGRTMMAFTAPAKYKSIEEMPVPKDARVTLTECPARDLAVITFSWGLNEARFREHETKLRMAAARENVKLSEDPRAVELWGYNPPWCLPWCKTNEVAIPIVK